MNSQQISLRNEILESLYSVGAYIDEKVVDKDADMDIAEFITDSLMFVSFIIELEERLDIEIPDELLSIEAFSSLNGFISLVDEMLKSR